MIVGEGTTKSLTEVTIYPPSVTVIFPVVASAGTVTVNCVAVAALTVAEMSLNFTSFSEGIGLKLDPVIVTVVPTIPLVGANPDMVVSRTVKSAEENAFSRLVKTLIFPEVAVGGTVTVSSVADALEMIAVISLNATILSDGLGPKFSPEITTVVPGTPDVGVKPVITGGLTFASSSPSSHEIIKWDMPQISDKASSLKEIDMVFMRVMVGLSI